MKFESLTKAQNTLNTLQPVAYLACPYTDPNPDIRQFRLRAITQLAYEFFKQGRLVYSPLTHNIPIDRLGFFGNHETWLNFDHSMLSRCNSFIIFKLPGWEQSKGVAEEMKLAKNLNLPIEEIEATPEFLAKIPKTEDSYSAIEELNIKLKKMILERGWNAVHSAKNIAMSLQVEASEVADHFVWLTEEKSNHLPPLVKQQVAEELGDVFINLIMLSDVLGIDLLTATTQKLEQIKKKYPVEIAKGRRVKYSELWEGQDLIPEKIS